MLLWKLQLGVQQVIRAREVRKILTVQRKGCHLEAVSSLRSVLYRCLIISNGLANMISRRTIDTILNSILNWRIKYDSLAPHLHDSTNFGLDFAQSPFVGNRGRFNDDLLCLSSA